MKTKKQRNRTRKERRNGRRRGNCLSPFCISVVRSPSHFYLRSQLLHVSLSPSPPRPPLFLCIKTQALEEASNLRPGCQGGRSPVTWHLQAFTDLVPLTDMNMRANISRNFPGSTYRFYNGKSIYEFGHGLSYTTFSEFIRSAPTIIRIHLKSSAKIILSSLFSSKNFTPRQSIDVSDVDCQGIEFDVAVSVKNDGNRNGTHVVLLFWKPPNSSDVYGLPKQQLVGFDRVQVNRGVVEHLSLKVNVCRDLNVVDGDGKRKLILGAHTLVLGSSSERQVRGSNSSSSLSYC